MLNYSYRKGCENVYKNLNRLIFFKVLLSHISTQLLDIKWQKRQSKNNVCICMYDHDGIEIAASDKGMSRVFFMYFIHCHNVT